ncbi:hypothetical protein ACK3TF_004078 [Chlorella vulgaris]
MDQEEEPTCRVCWGGPGGPLGLADALLRPCACRSPIHLSCLHSWQVEKMIMLRDASRCEVCHELYQVPLPTLQALAEAGGIDSWKLRLVRCWAAARPALATAWKAVTCVGVVLIRYCHLVQSSLHSIVLCAGPGVAPELWNGGATPPSQLAQLARLATVSAPLLVAWCALEYAFVRDWQVVRRQGSSWRVATKVATGSAMAAAALLLQRWCHVEWHAAGAPDKQPVSARAADMLAWFTLAATTLRIISATATWSLILGDWGPKALRSLTADGKRLFELGHAAGKADWEQFKTARNMLLLFQQRPAALRSLHAALRRTGQCWFLPDWFPTAVRSWLCDRGL